MGYLIMIIILYYILISYILTYIILRILVKIHPPTKLEISIPRKFLLLSPISIWFLLILLFWESTIYISNINFTIYFDKLFKKIGL